VIGSFLTVMLNVLFVVLLLEPLQHCAIALSTSLCVLINFLFLSVALHREVGGYKTSYLFQSFIKIVITAVIMGIIGERLNQAVMGQMPANLLGELCALFIAIMGSILFYFTVIFNLKIKEVDYLWARLLARLRNR
jgi:putative peptidoglycan lipid II flippase